MKPYAFFIGCNIPARAQQYETATRAVSKRLGIELKDFRDFNCCGYPMRNADEKSFVLSSAKNLAIAEKAGLDIMALCKCCFGTLKTADHLLKENPDLRAEMNRYLSGHGLAYTGQTTVYHFLSVLYHYVERDTLKSNITKPFRNLKIATHYGCHALRPSTVTEFDDPVAPSLFDELVEVTGAKSVDWETRLECCGAPLMGIHDDLSMDLTRKKVKDAKSSGAHYLCSACPWCQIQFDSGQEIMISENLSQDPLASILYPQLLGLSMGINGRMLGIGLNRLDISGITSFFAEG